MRSRSTMGSWSASAIGRLMKQCAPRRFASGLIAPVRFERHCACRARHWTHFSVHTTRPHERPTSHSVGSSTDRGLHDGAPAALPYVCIGTSCLVGTRMRVAEDFATRDRQNAAAYKRTRHNAWPEKAPSLGRGRRVLIAARRPCGWQDGRRDTFGDRCVPFIAHRVFRRVGHVQIMTGAMQLSPPRSSRATRTCPLSLRSTMRRCAALPPIS